MINTTYLQGKPFFIPGQGVDITYDSLLGLSLTLYEKPTEVYLSKYHKTLNSLDMVFCTNTELIASVHETLEEGIQTIQFNSNNILSGVIVVINTVADEQTDQRIEISPKYIQYTNNSRIYPTSININNEDIKAEELILNFDANVADVSIDAKGVATVTFIENEVPVIVQPQKKYIKMFDGVMVDADGTGTLSLPQTFKLTSISNNFALIRPYTYETCQTTTYTKIHNSNISCNISHSEDDPLPLDVCFERNPDYPNNSSDPWILNPYRIDTLNSPSGIPYLSLNPLHDNTEAKDV